jgi:hypothetical protein
VREWRSSRRRRDRPREGQAERRRALKRAAALVALLPVLLLPAGAAARESGGTIGAFVVTARDVVVLGGDLRSVAGRIPIRDGRSVAATIDARTVVVTTPRGFVVIDGRRRKIVATIGGFADPRGVALAFRGGFAVVADAGRREAIGVDVSHRRIAWRVRLGGRPARIDEVDDWYAVVSAYGERTLSLLDLTLQDAPVVHWIKARRKLRVAAFAPDGEWLYLGYWGRRSVSKLELFNRRIVSSYELRAPPHLLAVDVIEKSVWAAEG